MKETKYQLIENSLFFLMGLFVFSSMCTILSLQFLKLPMAMPELLIIPFLFFLKKKFKTLKFHSIDFAYVLIVIAVLLLFGMLYGQFSLKGMLSVSRSWAYMLLCMFVFTRKNMISADNLMFLAFGSVFGWFVVSIFNYQVFLVSISDKSFANTYGLMLAIPLFLTVSLDRSKQFVFFLGLFFVLGIIVFAGIRRTLAVAVLAIIIAFIMSSRNLKRSVLNIIILLIIIAVLQYILPLISGYLYDVSYGMYHRLFGRTEIYLEGGVLSSDQHRINNISSLFDNFVDLTIPHGMVSLRTQSEEGTGLFNDYPLYELCWMFGWITTIVIMIWFFNLLLQNYRKYKRYKDTTSMISVNCLLVMFMLLFLEGTFLNYPYAAPITGVLIGRAILNAKSKLKIA